MGLLALPLMPTCVALANSILVDVQLLWLPQLGRLSTCQAERRTTPLSGLVLRTNAITTLACTGIVMPSNKDNRANTATPP